MCRGALRSRPDSVLGSETGSPRPQNAAGAASDRPTKVDLSPVKALVKSEVEVSEGRGMGSVRGARGREAGLGSKAGVAGLGDWGSKRAGADSGR